ncbi:hypothetical protein F4806DRAFT_403826 [Annulohypoxylon nitens]|nr:hypothetical protein F4806DRAFT_403826 [Annulohypoxylon nitens]
MAEAAGLVLGTVSIAMAFKGAVDTALFIESFFEKGKREYGSVALAYHVQKIRLELWGKHCEATDSHSRMFREKTQDMKNLIVQILKRIELLNREVNDLADKHGIATSMTEMPATDLNDNLRLGGGLAKEIAKGGSKEPKLKSVIRWVIKVKSDFKGKIDEIRTLITDLQDITLQPRERQLLENGLDGPALARVHREDFLRIMSDLDPTVPLSLALSAHAKLLQSKVLVNRGSATNISRRRLTPIQDSSKSSNIYSFKRDDGQSLTARVEWNEFNGGPDTQQYIDRIGSLGYMLEQVSEPTLRLPPCYGVYDDEGYEKEHREHGWKRLGYVFGIPNVGSAYDGDLLSHPPAMLNDLIKPKGHIPLLGERFQLAYTLACAFSRFHAAGWLHKGFHTGSILFFQKRGGQGIDVTEPFVTGFQYSRPQGADSLSYSPLDNKELDYYYHPDADKGFTRTLDLYSLGVVLLEIGRWELFANRPKPFKTRKECQAYMLDKGVRDLGWRMGKKYQGAVETLLNCDLPTGDSVEHGFFARQYLDKVMEPLISCSA